MTNLNVISENTDTHHMYELCQHVKAPDSFLSIHPNIYNSVNQWQPRLLLRVNRYWLALVNPAPDRAYIINIHEEAALSANHLPVGGYVKAGGTVCSL